MPETIQYPIEEKLQEEGREPTLEELQGRKTKTAAKRFLGRMKMGVNYIGEKNRTNPTLVKGVAAGLVTAGGISLLALNTWPIAGALAVLGAPALFGIHLWRKYRKPYVKYM